VLTWLTRWWRRLKPLGWGCLVAGTGRCGGGGGREGGKTL